MKGLPSLSLLLKETNHQLYSAEAELGPRHLENRTTTWNPRNSFIMHCHHTTWWKEWVLLKSWGWFEFRQRAAHTFATFCTGRKATQLLWLHTQGIGICHSTFPVRIISDESLSSQSSDSSSWDSHISVGVVFKKLFANMTSISQAEQAKDLEPFDADPWAQQLNL